MAALAVVIVAIVVWQLRAAPSPVVPAQPASTGTAMDPALEQDVRKAQEIVGPTTTELPPLAPAEEFIMEERATPPAAPVGHEGTVTEKASSHAAPPVAPASKPASKPKRPTLDDLLD